MQRNSFSVCIIRIRLYVTLFPNYKSKILEPMVSELGRTRDIYSFRRLSKLVIERRGHVMERLIISLCYDDSNCFSIDLARYEIFKYRKNVKI